MSPFPHASLCFTSSPEAGVAEEPQKLRRLSSRSGRYKQCPTSPPNVKVRPEAELSVLEDERRILRDVPLVFYLALNLILVQRAAREKVASSKVRSDVSQGV